MANKSSEAKNEGYANQEEEYDPVVHRPPGPLTSDFAAFMHLLKSALGSGILILPNGFKRAGYVVSLTCSLVMGLLCIHSVVRLVKCSQVLCKRYRIPMLDLAKTVETSFQSGPQQVQKYGKYFGIFTNVILCFVQFQAATIYVIYVTTSFQQVIEFFSGVTLDVRIYILAFFPFFCMLGFVPNLKYLVPFSIMGFLMILFGVFVTFYYMLDDLSEPRKMKPYTYVLPVPMYCVLFLFAMHNVTMFLPLENTMKTPSHLPFLLRCEMVFAMILNTLFGFLGYHKYVDDTCDTVIKNLPLQQPLAQFIKVAISLSVMCSFGLSYYVTMSVFWPMVEPRFEQYKYGKIIFRFCGLLIIITIAIAIPKMVPLLGLLTAFSITTTMLFLPTLVETLTKWNTATKLLLAKNIGFFVLWLMLMLIAATESMRSLIREYSSEKPKEC